MGGLIKPTFGPIGGPGAAVVPAVPDPWLLELDPSNTGAFTLSGTSILAYTNRGITLASTLAQACTLDTVHTLGGKPVVALSSTGYTRLYTTGGGVQGDAPHSIFAVVRQRSASAAFQAIALFGQQGQNTSALGFDDSNNAWAGGKNFGAPTSPPPSVGTAFVLAKLHDAALGGTWLLVDGLPPVQSGEALPTGSVYALPSGFGIDTFNGFAAMPEADVGYLGFRASSPTLRGAQTIIKALADAYLLPPLPSRILCYGDSITFGTIGTGQTANPYPDVLQSDLRARGFTGVVTINRGNPGWTTGELLNGVGTQANGFTPQVENVFTLRARQSWFVLMAGTNDIKPVNSFPAQVAIANLTTMFQRAKSLGMRCAAITLFPYQTSLNPDPGAQSRRNQVNNWLRTVALPSGLVEALVDMESPANVAKYGDMSADGFHSDDTHPNQTGYTAIGHMVADTLAAAGLS